MAAEHIGLLIDSNENHLGRVVYSMSILNRFLTGCAVSAAVGAVIITASVGGYFYNLHNTWQSYWSSPEGIKANRRQSLPTWAASAVDAGDVGKARGYAEEMLKTGDDDDTHHAHTILGRIALRGGDLKEANAQLLASAHVSQTPVLGSFGPNMQLAQELLNKGETKSVLAYFKLCGKFWAYPDMKPHEELLKWTDEVKAGKTPDFGPNLVY